MSSSLLCWRRGSRRVSGDESLLHPPPDGMAFWPFNRRKKKAADKLQEKDASSSATREPTRNNLGNGAASEEPKRRTLKSFKRETKPAALSSPPESKPPVPEKSALRPPVPPVPPETSSSTTNPFDEKVATAEQDPNHQSIAGPSREPLAELRNPEALPPAVFEHANTGSQTSLQPENNFTVMPLNAEIPTLRPKRESKTGDAARRKSSKRKSSTRDREQEIKQMTSPIPIPKRPQTFSSSPLARDTKRVPGGLNRHFERPPSEVSLPVPESVRSSMSGDSEWQHSYKVSTIDALSPRPTIKYAESPRLGAKEYRASRASIRREKAPAIPEEPFNVKARMDDLADDLDAKALRELMDRDRRRRERKKKADQEKLQRKLQRKAERQRATSGPQATVDTQQGEDVEMKDAYPTSGPSGQGPVRGESSAQGAGRPNAQSPSSWLQDPSREHLPSPPADPFDDAGMGSHLDLGPESEQASMRDEPVIETAKAVRLSSASMSPPLSPVQKQTRGQSSLSNLVSASTQDVPEAAPLPESEYLQPPDIRRDSESSSRAEGSSWTSFFRRRATKAQRKSSDKDRHTPSEFSNTSRESFARSKQPPPAPVVQRSFRRDGTPQRTQSKFREDLPELPLSPPRSRVQSPEVAQTPSPYIDDQSKVENLNDEARVSTPIEDVHPAFREQVSIDQSMRSPSPEGPTGGVLSQSLASIDSEGSWLSGRQPKRSSIPISSLRESQASLSQQLGEENEQAVEEPTFSRHEVKANTIRGPGALSAQLRHLRTSSGGEVDSRELYLGEDSAEGSIKYDTVKGRKPNIVQRSPYFKSREGLLDDYTNAEEVSPVSPISQDSPDTPEREPTSIHRATSVDYGKRGHVRQLSAGSARLLDIPARSSSAENKRNSMTSDKTKSPLSETFAEEMEEPQVSP